MQGEADVTTADGEVVHLRHNSYAYFPANYTAKYGTANRLLSLEHYVLHAASYVYCMLALYCMLSAARCSAEL